MNEQQFTYAEAEAIVRDHLTAVRDAQRTAAKGHQPDENGRYPQSHRIAKETAELIEMILSGQSILSPETTQELAEAFESGNPIDALNKLLEELAFGPLLAAPKGIIEELGDLLGQASGSKPQIPSLESRTRGIRINYLMQRHGISRDQAQKKLDEIIAQFQLQYSRMPDDEDLDYLLETSET